MTTLATLLGATAAPLPAAPADAWPIHVAWLGVVAVLVLAGLVLGMVFDRHAPTPHGATADGGAAVVPVRRPAVLPEAA